MRVFCNLTWEDIVRESKYEYVARLWYIKIAKCVNGSWPGPMPSLIMMENEDGVIPELNVDSAGGDSGLSVSKGTK